MNIKRKLIPVLAAALSLCFLWQGSDSFAAGEGTNTGGGYAAGGMLGEVGYTSELYDASNGLPTSDANVVYAARDGYIWIGGYSGIIRYDGNVFERLDSSDGLTSGRAIFEDSKGRLWIGTNDNGVVVLTGDKPVRFTYEDGLHSSSIRAFAEDADGNVYIASTSGVAYADPDLTLHLIDKEGINGETVRRLEADSEGLVYGVTDTGDKVFTLNAGQVVSLYEAEVLGLPGVDIVYPDPDAPGKVYYGTEDSTLYFGTYGEKADKLEKIDVSPADKIYWIEKTCGRIWLTSDFVAGFLDDDRKFHVLDNVPMNSSIEMFTADYQGNLWFASSRQGVMKVVTNNFRNLSEIAGIDTGVVNSTCLINGKLYIGTDSGLLALDRDYKPITDSVTEHVGGARVRCIKKDKSGNLWICTYTGGKGLVCVTPTGQITDYNEDTGLIGNKVRCVEILADGTMLVCTNSGLSVMKDGKVTRNIGASDVITNTVFLTVAADGNGTIYAGSDGDGIYVIKEDEVKRIGRGDGLTSDVILRLANDERRGVLWIITSNSIQYIKNGIITNVDSFPYNNNFEIFFGKGDDIWILSSLGVYSLSASDLLANSVEDYRLFTVTSGLPGAPTANAFSHLDDTGKLYIAERSGVCVVDVDHFYRQQSDVRLLVKSVNCDGNEVKPDENGAFTIPANTGRIQITPAILDYSITNPLVRVFVEGTKDSGITAEQKNISSLEYTGLGYGTYNLHIQILDKSSKEVLQDETFKLIKKPKLTELLIIRVLFLILLAMAAGFFVWRFMKITVIKRQYEEVRQAKDEADRANTAKSRFLANMSHEIRTPINTIMGMDEMIMREDPAEVPKGYFMSVMNHAMDIRNASESLLELVNDLLDLSKIESGKMNLVEQEYDIEELLRSVVAMIRVRSNEKDLAFGADVDEMIPRRLYGDSAKIKQIVINLLTNAVKYTEIGGLTLKVTMEGRTDDRCDLKFSVKDTGVGIKQEDMDKLFTAYERLDEVKNTGIQGTGLGLDISGKFAKIMGGTLNCSSVYGEGSEFVLTLSQKIVKAEPIGEFKERDDNDVLGPYVPQFVAPDADVLVVDDNPMGINIIKELLKATKVFVTTASSGPECLEKMKGTRFNVVLVDHMMPGMDGIETLEKIREFDKETPVYALTANGTMGEDYYVSKGFDGLLPKPIDSKLLESIIMRHIPPEMMETNGTESSKSDITEIPDDLLWIRETEGIDADEGIKKAGGIKSFIFGLNLFYDTIDENISGIKEAADKEDLKLLAAKAHDLSTSAGLIGAKDLYEKAKALEEAGNRGDKAFTDANTDRLLEEYAGFKTKLGRLKAKGR